MDKERFEFLVDKCLFEVDENEYPEICVRLKWAKDIGCEQEEDQDYEDYLDDLFDIACGLHNSDETKVLPPSVSYLMKEIYLEVLENGNYDAATNLGSMYYTGRDGHQDFNKAVEYYTIAAEHGERQAQENLGYCYYYGRIGEPDYEKAFNYFAMGAFDGHLRSLYKIGDMYRYGYYVKKNEDEAFIIYNHCYHSNNETADEYVGADIAMRLGDCFFEGIGTEVNLERALILYQEAEVKFYRRLMTGDFLMKNGYNKSIKRQDEVRKMMIEGLPEYEWTKFSE